MMKKVLLIFFCFATMNVSAQYYDPGYAAYVNNQLNAMLQQQMMANPWQPDFNWNNVPQYQPDFNWGNAPCYVPDCNQSSESDYGDSSQRSSASQYESRYGDKDCYSCHVRPVTEKDGIDPRLEITVNVRIANTVSPEYATLAMAGEKYMA